MYTLTEAGHADRAMSLRPRIRGILVLVAPDVGPLPTRPPGERPSRSAGATTNAAATTWHCMDLSPNQLPLLPPPKHPSPEERRAQQDDQPSITPDVIEKVLGMPAHEAVEFLVRHL
jgi:hypothetical protein